MYDDILFLLSLSRVNFLCVHHIEYIYSCCFVCESVIVVSEEHCFRTFQRHAF